MKQMRTKKTWRQRGQGMAEYIIIVLVIAVLTIAVATRFGNQIRNLFSAAGDNMAGTDTAVDNKMGSGADVDREIGDLGNGGGG